MKCYACGGTYIEHNEALHLHNYIIGDYDVSASIYYKCDKCGELSFPNDTLKKIESIEIEEQNKLINQLPVNEFVFANTAAELLGITKQAFNKNRRIRNGFIYSVSLEGKKLYNKKSILLFKKNGDGRFKLYIQPPKEVVKYLVLSKNMTADPVQYKKIASEPHGFNWTKIDKTDEQNYNSYLN